MDAVMWLVRAQAWLYVCGGSDGGEGGGEGGGVSESCCDACMCSGSAFWAVLHLQPLAMMDDVLLTC